MRRGKRTLLKAIAGVLVQKLFNTNDFPCFCVAVVLSLVDDHVIALWKPTRALQGLSSNECSISGLAIVTDVSKCVLHVMQPRHCAE